MSDKRRPPSLHRGPAPVREPISDPSLAVLTFVLTGRETHTITVPRERVDAMNEEIAEAIVRGKTFTLHDPNGQRTILNTAHVIRVDIQ